MAGPFLGNFIARFIDYLMVHHYHWEDIDPLEIADCTHSESLAGKKRGISRYEIICTPVSHKCH